MQIRIGDYSWAMLLLGTVSWSVIDAGSRIVRWMRLEEAF